VGIHYLQVHVNDERHFIESDDTDDVAWTSFALSRDSHGNSKISLISHSPCSSVTLCGESLPNR